MDKKGVELSLQTIIVIILAIIVLVILIIAFRSQMTSLFDSFFKLITNANESVNDLGIIKK